MSPAPVTQVWLLSAEALDGGFFGGRSGVTLPTDAPSEEGSCGKGGLQRMALVLSPDEALPGDEGCSEEAAGLLRSAIMLLRGLLPEGDPEGCREVAAEAFAACMPVQKPPSVPGSAGEGEAGAAAFAWLCIRGLTATCREGGCGCC